MMVLAAKAVGATERWQLEGFSPGLASGRVGVKTGLRGSAPGEAQCPISLLLRYGDEWTDWRTTWGGSVGNEETLDLEQNEDIVAISGYSRDGLDSITSLLVESSSGRSWGPYGTLKPDDGSLQSSPNTLSNGLRLRHISGGHTKQIISKYILRWLHQPPPPLP